METQKKPHSAALVAIFEVLLIFIVGIMGNKIAENLQLPPIIIGVITLLCLLILSAISYAKNHDMSAQPIKQLNFGVTISRFIPKTVIGIFPIGLTAGFIIGMLTLFVVGDSIVGIFGVGILSFDFFGILCGLGICLLFAVIFDGPLASGLALGYGLSYSTSALLLKTYYSPTYYLAYIVSFLVLAIVLASSEAKFAAIRQTITEPRL